MIRMTAPHTIHPAIRPAIRPSVHPSVRPSVHPSIRLSVHPSIRPSVHPSVRASVDPSIRPHLACWAHHAGDTEYEVDAVLDQRRTDTGQGVGRSFQYFVHWKGYDDDHNQWLDSTQLLRILPPAPTHCIYAPASTCIS